MDLRLLEEISVFARHLNYSQAAKELYVSQPTLSQHMAKVESELGFNLFAHDGTNRPTLAGQVFCSEVGSLLASWRDLVGRCAELAAQEARSVRVLDLRMALQSLTFPEARACAADVVYIPCETVRAASEFAAVSDGEVDVAFAFAPTPDPAWFQDSGYVERPDAYRLVPLAPERCVLRVSSANPLAGRGSVSLDELEDYVFVYNDLPLYHTCDDAIQAALARTGHKFKSIVGMGNAKTSILSADPRYVSVLIETPVNLVGQVLEPQLSTVGFKDFELEIYPFALVRSGELAPAVRGFVEAVAAR